MNFKILTDKAEMKRLEKTNSLTVLVTFVNICVCFFYPPVHFLSVNIDPTGSRAQG